MATSHSQADIDAAYDDLCAIALSARTSTHSCLHLPFKTALSTYSRLATQSLSTLIQSKLPRELRDMIYTHYWQSLCGTTQSSHPSVPNVPNIPSNPDPIMLRRHRPWTKPCPRQNTSSPCKCKLSWETNPHLVLPAFVGMNMAQEAGIAAYKVFNSNWYSGPEPGELRAYLEVDWYHLGLKPGDYYTWLHIYICTPYIQAPAPVWSKCRVVYGPMFSDLGKKSLLNNFSALAVLKNKSRLHVKIQLDELRLENIERFLRAIRPVWRDLAEAGARVEILGDVPPKAFEELGPWVDLSGFYTMEREEWRREMAIFKW